MKPHKRDANNRLTNMVEAVRATRYAYTDFGALLSKLNPCTAELKTTDV